MLGKTPAMALLAAMFTMFAGAAPCAAEGASAAAAATEASAFNTWRDQFRARALKAGIPHSFFEKALGDVRPDPTVHEKDADQPEFTRPIWDYLDGALSDTRIKNGRKMLQRHTSLLSDAERAWGVPRHFIVAIWGMETSYGALLGNHDIFEALATLSYRGDRTEYGEEQLLAALHLLADGHKPREAMKSSWAGAVGHTQFVPTTYLKYAVDGDKDGRRDLWDSLSDVFHSTAHYLKKSGFNPNLKWGREAFLPEDFDYALANYEVSKPLSEWRRLGVKMANGALVPDMEIPASILVPAGHQGPAFLIYENFKAILAYNRSTSYALAIGLLSDQLRGGPSLKKSWPRHLKPLRRDERMEIQQRLQALGYKITEVDGVLGRETTGAIQAFQKDRGKIADGYATPELLTELRSARPEQMASAAPAAAESAGTDSEEAVETASVNPDGASAVPETETAAETDGGADTGSDREALADGSAAPAGDPAPESPAAVAVADPAAAEEDKPSGADSGTAAQGTALRPRTKPAVIAEEAATVPARPDGPVPAHPQPQIAGVTSALAAPGLVILGDGVAAPLPRPKQAVMDPSATAGKAVPVNSGSKPIVSPPGIAYVGDDGDVEEAEAEPGGEETGESDIPEPAPDPGS